MSFAVEEATIICCSGINIIQSELPLILPTVDAKLKIIENPIYMPMVAPSDAPLERHRNISISTIDIVARLHSSCRAKLRTSTAKCAPVKGTPMPLNAVKIPQTIIANTEYMTISTARLSHFEK